MGKNKRNFKKEMRVYRNEKQKNHKIKNIDLIVGTKNKMETPSHLQKNFLQQLPTKSNSARGSEVVEFNKVLDESDVLLEVLDARDPLRSRCFEVEQRILGSGKRLVLILNKVDLVPLDNLRAWLANLRRSFPTLPFRCNRQQQSHHFGAQTLNMRVLEDDCAGKSNSVTLGLNELMRLLHNYLRIPDDEDSANRNDANMEGEIEEMQTNTVGGGGNDATKNVGEKSSTKKTSENLLDKLTIGVIGLPNTGKSSLINSLMRRKVSEAGQLAGLTKQARRFNLTKKISLLDSPGLLLATNQSPTATETAGANYSCCGDLIGSRSEIDLILLNCRRVENIEDPLPAANAIFDRVCAQNPTMLFDLYNLGSKLEREFQMEPIRPPKFQEFLVQMAHRCGKLKQGGLVNLEQTARKLIYDWIVGKISYFTDPPVEQTSVSSLQDVEDETDEMKSS